MLWTICAQGLIYTLAVLAARLTSRMIRFDDLGLEGSFGAGGATVAALMAIPWLPGALVVLGAVGVGALLGLVTALLNVRLRLNNLLAGVIVTTAVYSFNLKLAGALNPLARPTLFNLLEGHMGPSGSLLALAIIVGATMTLLAILFRCEHGYLIVMVGENPSMLTSLGKRVGLHKGFCLALAHGLAALAGALLTLQLGYFSISAGVGTLVMAVAGLMLGEVLTGGRERWIGCFLGAITYQGLLALTVLAGMPPVYNKLCLAALIVVVIWLRHIVMGRQECAPC